MVKQAAKRYEWAQGRMMRHLPIDSISGQELGGVRKKAGKGPRKARERKKNS